MDIFPICLYILFSQFKTIQGYHTPCFIVIIELIQGGFREACEEMTNSCCNLQCHYLFIYFCHKRACLLPFVWFLLAVDNFFNL